MSNRYHILRGSAGSSFSYIIHAFNTPSYNALCLYPHMTPKTYRVLLAGYGDMRISAEYSSLFKRARCVVDVYCPKRSRLSIDRSWNVWHQANVASLQEFTTNLAELTSLIKYDWVIPIDDSTLWAVHDYLDATDAEKILPIQNMEHKALAASKTALSVLSAKHGINTPTFTVYDSHIPLSELTAGLPYPILAKVDRSGGGKGVFYCEDEQALKKILASLSDTQKKNLLLQSYVRGDTIAVEALYKDGSLIDYSCGLVLKTIGTEFGASIVREYVARPELTSTLQEIGTSLGFAGFCSYTFMYDRINAIYYLVEADLRPHSWFLLARFCGIDFSKSIRSYLSDSRTESQRQLSESVLIRHFTRDLTRSVTQLDSGNILAWLTNAEGRWRYIPWHDNRLWFVGFIQLLRSILWTIRSELKSSS